MPGARKIRLMIRLALMEQHKGKELEQAENYYRSDYIGIRMFRAGLYVTAAFLIGGVLWLCRNLDAVMRQLNELNIWGVAGKLCAVYAALIGAALLMTYIRATRSYFQIQKELHEYRTTLEKLEKEYQKQ